MNKKAISPITVIFWYFTGFFVWAMFAAEKIRYWGIRTVELNNLTGIEAFAYSNMNLILFFMSLIFIVAVIYWVSE